MKKFDVCEARHDCVGQHFVAVQLKTASRFERHCSRKFLGLFKEIWGIISFWTVYCRSLASRCICGVIRLTYRLERMEQKKVKGRAEMKKSYDFHHNSLAFKYRGRESNPYGRFGPQDFKSCVSTSSTTSAGIQFRQKKKAPLTGAIF